MLFKNPEKNPEFSVCLHQHVPFLWGSWTCTFSHSDLCSEAVSLRCTLMYASNSHVAGELACLPVCLSWDGPGHRLGQEAELPSVTPDVILWWSARYSAAVIPGGRTTITLSCWHHRGLWTACVWMSVSKCVLLQRYFNNQRPFFPSKHEGFCLMCPEGFHM